MAACNFILLSVVKFQHKHTFYLMGYWLGNYLNQIFFNEEMYKKTLFITIILQ